MLVIAFGSHYVFVCTLMHECALKIFVLGGLLFPALCVRRICISIGNAVFHCHLLECVLLMWSRSCMGLVVANARDFLLFSVFCTPPPLSRSLFRSLSPCVYVCVIDTTTNILINILLAICSVELVRYLFRSPFYSVCLSFTFRMCFDFSR